MDNEKIKALQRALKGKRAAFVEEYIKDRNATAAAIRAGIPEAGAAVQASRFLREPEVLAYRDALIDAAAEIAGVTKESLMVDLEDVKRRCMSEKAFDPRGAAKAVELQAKLIGALTEKREIETNGFAVLVTEKGIENAEADPS